MSEKGEKKTIIKAIDLFCGAGGLTHGLEKAGVVVVAGIDNEETCRFAYELNNPGAKFICKGVEQVEGAELEKYWGKGGVRLLAGCAPCQPFSTYSQGKNPAKDRRYPLLSHFERLIRETLPELVTMENVPNVALHSVFDEFKATLEQMDYKVWSGVVDCPSIGIPQNRRRMVLLASLISKQKPCFIYPELTELPTVRNAFKGLPRLKAGGASKKDRLHRCQALSPVNLERIKVSSPGGTWREWPSDLVLPCHRKKSGKGYASVYGRMSLDEVAPTMTTQCYNYGSGRFGHPTQNRPISLREAAIIQSFPRSYQFDSAENPMGVATIAKMIGNAVPVLLGKAVGESLLKSI